MFFAICRLKATTLLITYDLEGDSPDVQPTNGATGSPRTARLIGRGFLLLPCLVLICAVRAPRKYRTATLCCVLLVGGLWFAGCNNGIGPGPGPASKTYRVTLTGVGAEEAESGENASVDDLSLMGTILTVSQ